MMYKVREYFTDLQDNGYAYKGGDTYPRKGYEPTAERIEMLSTDKNVRKRPIIEAIEETSEDEETTNVNEDASKVKESSEEKKPRGRKRKSE
jgi:hypothetical protein